MALQLPGKSGEPAPSRLTPATRSRPYEVLPLPAEMSRDDESTGLIEVWRLLRRRKGTLAIACLIGILAAFFATLPQAPVYQARGSVEIQNVNEDFMNMRQVDPNAAGTNYQATDSYLQTQIKIIQSESLIDRVVAKMKAAGLGTTTGSEGRAASWRKILQLSEPTGPEAQDQNLKGIAKTLRARASGQTRLVELMADSTDPKLAAAFVNTLVSEYMDQNLETRYKSTQQTSAWLTRQLEEMRAKLESSEDALQAYARNSGLLITSEKNNVSEDKLRQLQEELSKAQVDRVEKQSRFEIASKSSPESLADVLNDSTLREYQTQLTGLRRQLAELSTTYTPEHYKVTRVEAQIASVEAALQTKRASIVSRIKNDFDEAQRRESLLSAAYGGQVGTVTSDSEKSIKYTILKREVDSNRQLYEAMLAKVKESGIASAIRASNIHPVDTAKVPLKPYRPSYPQNLVLGMLSGLLLGAAFVVVRERADRTIQEPGESPFYLNVPELGVIPSGDSGRGSRDDRGLAGLVDRNASGSRASLNPGPLQGDQNEAATPAAGAEKFELVTWQRKPSMLAEAFRSVLTSILFSDRNEARPQIIVVSSSGPGEGKSTVTSNLAIAIAEVGRRVLLIDADLRRPRQHQIFNLKNTAGLKDLLTGPVRDTSPDPLADDQGPDVAAALIHESEVPGLFILTSGVSENGSANCLYSPRMGEILERFRHEFDTILIDTPPMLQIPDARVVGRLADSVILVVRSGKTARDAAIAARQRFAEDGIQVLGTVLNDWNPKSDSSGYYSGYYKSYQGYYGKQDRN